jgi:predicted glycoside hydrolase/deacetylase ChbG (UPF0249 family)
MKYLIVNADDFGMSPGVTAGIVDAHLQGIVTSTSMLVTTPFSDTAGAAAHEYPSLSVGLHLRLTHESGEALIDLDDRAAVRAELHSQFERFVVLTGSQPTHLDSHHHVHRDSRVRELFVELAQEHSLVLREHSAVRYSSAFYGQWDGETHLEQVSVDNLSMILSEIEPGVSELGCHPGYADAELRSSYGIEREVELRTLCDPSVRAALSQHGVRLIGFRELSAQPRSWEV